MKVLDRDEQGRVRMAELTTREQSLQVLFENRLAAGMSMDEAMEDLRRKFPGIMGEQSVEFLEYLMGV